MKQTLLTALAIAISGQCLADDVPALKISMSNGDDTVVLSELLSVKYTESDMVVNMKDGTKQVFPLDEIVVMEIGQVEKTSIKDLLPDYSNDATYSITDISGNVVAKGNVRDDISLPNVKGVYILSVGDKTKKIMIK